MAVRIGHAATSDNNDAPGDTTGREIRFDNWYNKPWTYVLRCKDKDKADLMAQYCEQIVRNDKVGYWQGRRNTGWKAYQVCGGFDKISVYCDMDCSSMMSACAAAAGTGLDIDGINAPTTRTMKDKFMATGSFELLTDEKYTHSDQYLERGDILCVPGSHCVMALSDGDAVPKPPVLHYVVGKVYTLQANMKVRSGPSLDARQKERSELTADGRKHAVNQKKAVMKMGTRVTCKEDRFDDDGNEWLRTPSGWMCARLGEKVYIA